MWKVGASKHATDVIFFSSKTLMGTCGAFYGVFDPRDWVQREQGRYA